QHMEMVLALPPSPNLLVSLSPSLPVSVSPCLPVSLSPTRWQGLSNRLLNPAEVVHALAGEGGFRECEIDAGCNPVPLAHAGVVFFLGHLLLPLWGPLGVCEGVAARRRNSQWSSQTANIVEVQLLLAGAEFVRNVPDDLSASLAPEIGVQLRPGVVG